ncbi:MAG: bifunctional glutamate N-acetyltransferase/amino-acid acetyltransferase ArgJ [Epsilonproteobacteria bacterium]|nr:bifunctional ornithine acetyltransferase/N-acetylglutamate synthase [Campylobacterota bacterium]NPA56199.1 bifunctional glutamate N-acetyltransferase/amino-acid acetyltransferase ArgJ [Campylobacterota bacterium]
MPFTLSPISHSIAEVDGFYCDGIRAGLKEDGLDLGFIYTDTPAHIAALFTTNRFQAAPLRHFQNHSIKKTNFILVNSKNANALTGARGVADIEEIVEALSRKWDLLNPVMSSTGVIGLPLPKEKIIAGALTFNLEERDDDRFARAIMTTDTFPKKVGFKVTLDDGSSFTVAGVAKGAGMIDPAMATMLAFIVTDGAVPFGDMEELLHEKVETTFNAISVDGDRSTNDTVFLLSNGKSGVYNREAFAFALERVMHELALLIVKDGEGAQKVVAFEVRGAKSREEAKRAAKALTNSLLVKTALFGEDPNWGRIAATIGASGVECDEERLLIAFGDVVVYNRGEITFDPATEERAHKVMERSEFRILCDLGMGEGSFTAYGCDLGYDYIKINAEYRT